MIYTHPWRSRSVPRYSEIRARDMIPSIWNDVPLKMEQNISVDKMTRLNRSLSLKYVPPQEQWTRGCKRPQIWNTLAGQSFLSDNGRCKRLEKISFGPRSFPLKKTKNTNNDFQTSSVKKPLRESVLYFAGQKGIPIVYHNSQVKDQQVRFLPLHTGP